MFTFNVSTTPSTSIINGAFDVAEPTFFNNTFLPSIVIVSPTFINASWPTLAVKVSLSSAGTFVIFIFLPKKVIANGSDEVVALAFIVLSNTK